MADVLLSSEDITVLGGPASISVDLDFGPEGKRGSNIFVGNGNPNSTNIGQTPNIFDLYINLLASDDEYLYFYQYQNVSGVDTWVRLVKLIPNTYSDNRVVTFVNGEKSVNIPVSKIVPPSMISSVTSENFNVQYSIAGNENPVSSSLSVLPIVAESGTGNLVLPISIKAIENSSGTWVDLENQVTLHMFITVV